MTHPLVNLVLLFCPEIEGLLTGLWHTKTMPRKVPAAPAHPSRATRSKASPTVSVPVSVPEPARPSLKRASRAGIGKDAAVAQAALAPTDPSSRSHKKAKAPAHPKGMASSEDDAGSPSAPTPVPPAVESGGVSTPPSPAEGPLMLCSFTGLDFKGDLLEEDCAGSAEEAIAYTRRKQACRVGRPAGRCAGQRPH